MAPIKFLYIFSIFLIKFSSIILSFQFSKLTNLSKNYKIIIFTLSCVFLLSLSSYEQNDYLNIRDLFVLIFFILLTKIILKNNSPILSYFLTLTTVVALFFHYDTGIYLCVTLIFYIFYLLISKNYKDCGIIIFFLIINILISYLYFGSNEIVNFYNQLIHIVKNIDKIHGLEYPQPFFSIGSNADGSRATKLLVFFIIIGYCVNSTIFLKNNFLINREKILILFIFFYSIISFKNALGRSDGGHMMLSSDWITILLFYYLIFSIFFIISLKFKNLYYLNYISKILPIIVVFCIFYQFHDKQIFNSYTNIKTYINKPNSSFVSNFNNNQRDVILKKINKILEKDDCIQNFTVDLSIPYLLDKPTCSKYFSSWIISGKKNETEYINFLKQEKSVHILYKSPHFLVDKIPTHDRLTIVDAYIKKNYFEVLNYQDYLILKKINVTK